jgi:prevent-host-death family protein
MSTVSLKEARRRLGKLAEAAGRGEAVLITRRGRVIAQLTTVADHPRQPLPDLTAFRDSLGVQGVSLTQELLEMRGEERG